LFSGWAVELKKQNSSSLLLATAKSHCEICIAYKVWVVSINLRWTPLWNIKLFHLTLIDRRIGSIKLWMVI
jgi:hypothetical protein